MGSTSRRAEHPALFITIEPTTHGSRDAREHDEWSPLVGGLEHLIARTGILEPLAARKKIYRDEFPSLLFLLARFEPSLDELDPRANGDFLLPRAEFEKLPVLVLGAKVRDITRRESVAATELR